MHMISTANETQTGAKGWAHARLVLSDWHDEGNILFPALPWNAGRPSERGHDAEY